MADVSERNHYINAMRSSEEGVCYAHGPYEGMLCPQLMSGFPSPCTSDPQKPEYVAVAKERARQTNKVYTQAEMDAALAEQREQCAVIAETNFDDRWGTGYRMGGLMIAAAIRSGKGEK